MDSVAAGTSDGRRALGGPLALHAALVAAGRLRKDDAQEEAAKVHSFF